MAGVGMREQGVVRPKMIAGLLLLSMVLPLMPAVAAAPAATTPLGGSHGTAFDEVTIAAGESHTCVIMKDGSSECWGDLNSGQGGYGGTDYAYTAKAVDLPSGKTLTSIDAGYRQTCGIMDTGELYCWGENGGGGLGDGVGGGFESGAGVVREIGRAHV